MKANLLTNKQQHNTKFGVIFPSTEWRPINVGGRLASVKPRHCLVATNPTAERGPVCLKTSQKAYWYKMVLWMTHRYGVILREQNAGFITRCLQCHKLHRQPPIRHISNQTNTKSNPFTRYLGSLKWVPIPLGVGFAYIAYQQYRHVVKRERKFLSEAESPEQTIAADWQVQIYSGLPLKAMSRLWGRVNDVELPVWLRSPVLKLYIWAFNCKLEEAAVEDLQHYKNLGQFFKRRLKPSVRNIDQKHSVICPSDGKVLHFGKIENGLVEQVKGITYTLQGFLGPTTWTDVNNNKLKTLKDQNPAALSDQDYHENVRTGENTDLYHCVIYLAPGDYHGFHSPTQWTITHRRHFPGELLSVNPGIARWVKGLFNINERAVYYGLWNGGFFSMAAVGATNVGSIKVYHDKHLETNQPGKLKPDIYFEEVFSRPDTDGVQMKKGESFGEFNLGSTIVLVFEAPKTFHFNLEPGQTVKYGQPLGCYK